MDSTDSHRLPERPLRVVIAPDEFGGTLAAAAAAAAMADGWASARPADRITLAPQSDGGPGFLDVLGAADCGTPRSATVSGPLGDPTRAHWLLAGRTAYIEAAQACGLALLGRPPDPDTALRADTRGVGELVAAALAAGVDRIVVGLGGSASTDGGRGLCEALGGVDAARRTLSSVDLVAATDVDNPLLGPHGAAAVFGPQKGADPDHVRLLEERLRRWADQLEAGARGGGRRPLRERPGSGAAGGLGYALLALGAVRESGASVVAEATRRARLIADADLVITGEGRFDAQSARGKVVAAVTREAAGHGVPVFVVAGQVDPDADMRSTAGVWSLATHRGSVAAAMSRPAAGLRDLVRRIAVDAGRGGMREYGSDEYG
ncbi:glycerate kinase [Gordonia shandongensis]|uniref:glycerate kinase n=1 Tax=Gordonia shandongensis TaxID=376351 RepID=UPI001B7F9B48|nr:glycerate kinase [Gordonia shandongensis]